MVDPTARGIVSIVLLASTLWATEVARADVKAQNQAAKRYATMLETRMRCSPQVEQRVQQSMDQGALPEHLRMAAAARTRFGSGAHESLRQMPAPMRQMLLNNPAMLQQAASGLGLTVDQARDLLSGKTVATAKASASLSRRAARITVVNELGALCDEACVANIRWTLVTAISGWKLACFSCSDDFFSVVTIDGHTWLDPKLAQWIRETPRLLAEQYPFKGEGTRPGLLTPTTRDRPPPMEMLELVDRQDPSIARVCSAPRPAPGQTDVLLRAQAAICGSGAGADDAGTARMRLELKSGPTSCGPADAFLGCGRPDNGIELTFDGTRYEFANVLGTRDAVVGPGREPALSGMTVLMHEVGHWFGLPHLNFRVDEIPDMMQDTYVEGACVSGLNAMLMSNMTDDAHAQRFRVGGGYRRPKR